MPLKKAIIKYKVADPKLRVMLEDLKNVINSIIDSVEDLEYDVESLEDELEEHIGEA